MIITLDSLSWGPKFIVPTIAIRKYCGCVVFRMRIDDDLLESELDTLKVSGYPTGYNNSWHLRKKGSRTWVKVGESSRREEDFRVRVDTTEFGNGSYQVLGFISVKVKTERKEVILSSQYIADIEIEN